MGRSFQTWSHRQDPTGGSGLMGVREVEHCVRWATEQRLPPAMFSGGRMLLNVLCDNQPTWHAPSDLSPVLLTVTDLSELL